MSQAAPAVLVIAFKRAVQLQRCVERLLLSGVTRIYFAVDGPRSLDEVKKVSEVRGFIDSLPVDLIAGIRCADRNYGCRAWVSSSISWFFDHEEFGVIVEEDILIDSRFIAWCEELRYRFRDQSNVKHINAFYPQSVRLPPRSPHLTRFATSWGWATWRRAWREYDDDMSYFLALGKIRQLRYLKARIGADWFTAVHYFFALHMAAQEKVSSWAYRWSLTIWHGNGLVISPGTNLSENIGVGPDATHTSHEKNLLAFDVGGSDAVIGRSIDDVSPELDARIFAAVGQTRNFVRTVRMLFSVIVPRSVFVRVRRLFR